MMNRLLVFLVFAVPFLGCTDKPQQGESTSAVTKVDTSKKVNKSDTSKKINTNSPVIKPDTTKFIYADSARSSFRILARDTNSGYTFESSEINYKLAYVALKDYSTFNHYIAKYTTTNKSCTDCELEQKNIKVELNPFDNPKTTELTIRQDCDDLTLNDHTYRTVKYGCCGGEDQFAIYDYENKLIIEGDSKIILGEIPNSHLSIYVAFEEEFKDSTIIGTIYYCYDSGDRYAIKIKSAPLPEDCDPNSPDITIHSTNPRDEFHKEDNQYTFWSLDKLENKNQINNLTLKITFECDTKSKNNTLTIPIINGKPNGKDDKNQELIYKRK